MKKTIVFVFFCLNFYISGFCQDFQWARQIKGITYDYADFANGLAVDSNENTYTVGSTDSPLFDLDPTVTGTEIIDNTIINNSFRGTYLIKTDKDGNYLWGLTFALNKGNFNGNDTGFDVKIGSDGNIYVLLSLSELNTSLNIMDTFIKIIKISPSGNIITSTSIKQNYGFNNNMYVYSFDLDNQNNIFPSGWFVGNIAINNNPNLNINNANGIGNYLLKINNNGNFDWIKQFNIGDNSSNEVIVRPDGNANFLVKRFNDYVLYNIDNLNGSIIWQKDFINQTQRTFHVSNNGIVILGGKNYYDIIDVDPSLSVLNISGFNTSFIIFLNLNGDLIDVKQFEKPSNGDIVFTAVTTDNDGNYFFGGQFKDTIDLDPSNNIFNITSNGYDGEAFYLKLDSNRNFDGAFKLGDENPKLSPYNNCYFIEIKGIKIVNKNNYLMGDFMWTCDFDPSTTTQYTLKTLNGVTINRDGFLLKLGSCDDSKVVGDIDQYFCSVSNPTISNLSPNSSSIKWYDSINSTSPLSNTIPLADNKKYYATRKNGNCPESTERLEITAHIASSPQAPTPINPEFCKNNNAKLADISISGQNVKWYANASDVSNIPITTLLENGSTYYVSQTVNGCESPRTPILVLIHNTASLTTTSPQTFCIQQNATLNSIAITGQNIKWHDALTNGNVLANTTLLQNGITYYASQTINGCESERVPVAINIQNTPAPTANTSQTFCASQNPTLSTLSIVGTAIKWYDNSTFGNLLADTTPLQDGQTYYATQTVNGCESPTRLGITVSLISSLPANNYAELFCDDLNDGSETVNLSSYNPSVISNTTNYNFSYYTSLSGAENETANKKITNFSSCKLVLGDNKIYVRINSNTPCYAVAELKLTLLSKPKITIEDIVPICENNTIMIDAGAGFDSYSWSNGATTQKITVANPGNFSVTVTNNYATISCSSTKNFTVKNSNKASINSIETKDWTDNENTISVFATGNGVYEYSIDGENFQDSNVFSGLPSGQYTVLVNDKNGCGTTPPQEVYLLMYPKFFTPNGDGYNDTWKIKFSDAEEGLIIKIFDRYGKLIKMLTDVTDGWNGTYNGAELPATDYWFIVTRANGTEYKGHFSLKR